MIDFTEIDSSGENFELFARDFLQEIGFFIETAPDRGADGGKDLLVTEKLKGRLGSYNFRWLVSCKHNAKSNKSVSEADEPNILERVQGFKADGFIGFYSTVPSSGLNNRFNQLRGNQLNDVKIFDHKLIENFCLRVGYSRLLQRYFPESYIRIKPLIPVLKDYQPLNCEVCNKDILKQMFRNDYGANLIFAYKIGDFSQKTVSIHAVCKIKCDRILSYKLKEKKLSTGWKDLNDLTNPLLFQRFNFNTMNLLKDDNSTYSDEAFKKLKQIIISISQKTLRAVTEKERNRATEVMQLPF